MALKHSLKKGDWIRAEHESGASIEGQAHHDMNTFGDAHLDIRLPMNKLVNINVNFWDVKITKANLIDADN